MKRALVPIAIVVTLGLPASAGATFREFYSGPVGDGGNNAGVELHAKFHNKRAFEKGKPPSRVVTFHWFNIPVPGTAQACFDSLTNDGFDMRVNDAGKFHGRFEVPNTDHKGIVRGKFKRRNRKVTGTLRVKGGHFSGGCVPGDSGVLSWVARHGARE